MELMEYLQVVQKRAMLILLITLVSAISAAIISFFVIEPVYQSKTTLIIGRIPDNNKEKVQYDDVLMYQNLVKTYAELAKSDLAATETISELNLNMEPEELKKNLTVTAKGDTQILEIAVQDRNPQKAADIANTLSEVFVNKVRELMNSNDVKILDLAKVPKKTIKPKKIMNTAIAGLLGLMVSLGTAFLLEYLDNTIKTEEDVEKYLSLTVLASIPFKEGKK